MAKLKLTFPTLRQPATIVSGTGSLGSLRDASNLDQTLFFVSGREEVRGLLARVLAKAGCELTQDNHIAKPPGEPTTEMILEGSRFLQGKDFRRIVGIGGGSTLDWCRLAGAEASGSLDMGSGRIGAGASTLPELWLIPTTCATGAEAAQVAVYLNEMQKIAATSPAFVADQVILDGRFLQSMSKEEVASSVCDTLSHGIEAFCSIVPNHLAKVAAVASLQLALRHFSSEASSCRNERLMEAGFLGGVAASNCSVGVVHAFAHSVAHLGIPHGVANGLGLVAGIRVNADTPAMQELADRFTAGSVDRLIADVSEITSISNRANQTLPGVEQLGEPATRKDVAQRMLGDVCLRSNPQPLEVVAIERFLDLVDEGRRPA